MQQQSFFFDVEISDNETSQFQKSLKRMNRFQIEDLLKRQAKHLRSARAYMVMTVHQCMVSQYYAEAGYSSLYTYLVKVIELSDGTARRMISAAHLKCDVPVLDTKIESGELSMAQVGMFQQAMRQMKNEGGPLPTAERKQEILEALTKKSERETQQELAKQFGFKPEAQTKWTQQADGTMRLEVTFTAEEYNQMMEAQAMVSHSLPDKDVKHYFLHCNVSIIKRYTPKREPKQAENSSVTPAQRRRNAYKQSCCYTDAVTGHRCGETWWVQSDHIHSQWAGGKHSDENLQPLCGKHNRFKYRQEAGIRYC